MAQSLAHTKWMCKIQKKNYLQPTPKIYTTNNPGFVQMEGRINTGSTYDAGLYSLAVIYFAQNKYLRFQRYLKDKSTMMIFDNM